MFIVVLSCLLYVCVGVQCQILFGIARYCPLLVLVFTSHAAVAACVLRVQELYGGLFLLSRCVCMFVFVGLCQILFGIVRYYPLLDLVFTSHAVVAACAV